MKRTAFATLIALSIAASSQALVMNGSFEAGSLAGSTVPLPTGSTAVDHWTMAGDMHYWIGNSTNSDGIWASDGNCSIDLAGDFDSAPGWIYQSFATTVGSTYTVRFDLGTRNISWGMASIMVKEGGNSAVFNQAPTDLMSWSTKTWSFVATSALSTLEFMEANPGQTNYVGLDNVVVSTVPEPATFAAIGIGLVMLRRKKQK